MHLRTTGEPLFETKAGFPLYGVGLAVLDRIPTKPISHYRAHELCSSYRGASVPSI